VPTSRGVLAQTVVIDRIVEMTRKLPRFLPIQKVLRGRQKQQHHCSVALDFPRKESVCVTTDSADKLDAALNACGLSAIIDRAMASPGWRGLEAVIVRDVPHSVQRGHIMRDIVLSRAMWRVPIVVAHSLFR
jgi:hypothetical protein